MCLAESVSARNERHGLFIIHRHAQKSLANVARRSQRIRLAVRPFWVDVNQAHLHRGKRVFEVAIARVALVAKPRVLVAPINVFLRFPDVNTPATKAECFQSHGFQCASAGKNHQISPGNPVAVFLLDRPKQPPRLVEIDIVWPAVERRKTLRAGSSTATPVASPVGAGAVPCHADEKRPVMPVIGRPPGLRIRHQRKKVLLEGLQIERLERLGIVEGLAHRVGQGRILVQNLEVELFWPPILVGPARMGRVRPRPVGDRTTADDFGIMCIHFSLP